jgi:hypothetical protein
MKQRFMCVEQTTGTIIMLCGSENIHDVNEYEHDSPKVNVWFASMKKKFTGPFILQERTVTGDNFLGMMEKMENIALCHVPVENFSSYIMQHINSLNAFLPFWTGSFLIVGYEEEDPFPGSILLTICLVWTFSSVGLEMTKCELQ